MLLTFALCCAILLAGIAIGALVTGKVRITVPIDIPPISVIVDLTQAIPTPVVLQVQTVPPDKQPSGIPDEAMPEKVFEYVAKESEEHARVSRGKYARRLKQELGSWDAALNQLKREDGEGVD